MLTRRGLLSGMVAQSAGSVDTMVSPPRLDQIPRGVNLESGSWGWWPTPNYYDYYLEKGFRFFRLCFSWTPPQPVLEGELSAPLLAHMDAVIDRVTSFGATIILDQHDYMRRGENII